MTKVSKAAWWSRLRPSNRADVPAHGEDFADMGTAFGLDASFGPVDDAMFSSAEDRGASGATHLADRLNGRTAY